MSIEKTSEHDLCLSVLSDIHVTHFDEPLYEGYKGLEAVLKFHTEELPDSDAYLFTGDTVYQVESPRKSLCEVLYPEIYERAKSLFHQYISEKPRVMIMGNHEYAQGNPDPDMTKEAQEMFRRAYGQELTVHRVVKGYHIIGASMRSWQAKAWLENEQFIMTEVEKAIAEAPDKPVFVMLHNPVPNTVTFSGKYTVGHYTDEFIDWLRTKPQLIVLSGHCHNINEDDSCIYQNGCTYVNIPIIAVGYMRFDGNGAPNFKNDYGSYFGKCQSVQITVDGNLVTIKSYDINSRRCVNEWTVDIAELKAGRGYRYTDDMHAALPAPAFAPDASLWVEEEDGKQLLTIRQRFLPYDYCRKYYAIDFIPKAGGDTVTVTYPSDYFMEKKEEIIKKAIPTLSAGDYVVNVYVCNSFAKRSEHPISTTLTVK